MLITILSLSVALQVAPPDKALRGKSRPDTIILLDSVITAEKRFFVQWSDAWKASEMTRHAKDDGNVSWPSTVREANIQCLPELERVFRKSNDAGLGPVIASGTTAFNVCPSWLLTGGGPQPGDERMGIDIAIAEARRPGIAAARKALLDLLDNAARAMPANNFVIGQRIRFLVDAGDLDRAVPVARECRASAWWCAALRGYVLARRGDMRGADDAFAVMSGVLANSAQCRWTDLRALLAEPGDRARYDKMSCNERKSVNTRLLWLADPLLSTPGNERRVEQFVRKVLVTLHTALDHDERYDWRPQVGGNARNEMIERYGWPSFVYWAGRERDLIETRLLGGSNFGFSPPNEPNTTYEYTLGREHLVPTFDAVLDPFHSQPADWSVAPLPATDFPSRTDPLWFPVEHFAAPYPLVQLPDGQSALFRRQANALLATATRIELPHFERPLEVAIDAVTLVVSSAPDSVRRVASMRGAVGAVAVLTGLIDARPAVIGVEFPNLGDRPAGRTRFGVTPPPPLASMQAHDVAISDPVILRAPSTDDPLPTDADSALALMAGSTRLSNGKIGVYWETYGFKPTDTVDVAVWIERHTPQGIIRNLGIALKVSTDLNTPVSLGWREPQSDHRVHVTDGPVPIIGRSLQLDTSALPKGEYWLDIAVRKPGSQPVRGRRDFSIQ